MVKRCVAFIASGSIAAGCLAYGPDFGSEVRPILAEHCFECHGPDKAKGGLNLTTREGATARLKSGSAAIVPGELQESEFVRRIEATDPDDRMPPDDKSPLKPREMDVLKRWIAAGAEYAVHWAYQPVARPVPPAVKDQRWSHNAIDRFVLSKLEAAGIRPSPEADRYTLIRRVYYDLAGLPPAPEEADRFAADPAPDAFERLVDRLLANPHFGERWGRHWLDAARYADSDGYEKDRPRPDAWRYRDWVIRAINEDMPFDQFTIEQIAGDLLPDATPEQIVATAFHRQTLTNDEGGVDKEQYRVEAVFDRVETVGTVWLGLTVGCARCHSHKYDRLTQREYYELFAFFNNADEVIRQAPTTPEAWREFERRHGADAAKVVSLQHRLDEAKARFATRLPEWENEIQAQLAEARAKNSKAEFQPLPVRAATARSETSFQKLEDGSWLANESQVPEDAVLLKVADWRQPITALRIELLSDDSLPGKGPGRGESGAFALTEVKARLGESADSGVPLKFHSPKADREEKGYPASAAVDANDRTGWAITEKTGEPHWLTLQFVRPLPSQSGRPLWITLENKSSKVSGGPGRFRLLGSRDLTEESILPDSIRRTLAEEPVRRPIQEMEALVDWAAQWDEEVVALSAELERARQRLPGLPLMDVRVVAQRRHSPRVTRVLNRGDFLSPTDEIGPGTPSVLPPLRCRGGDADRLDLARWLVSPRNPLTPRVTVNHVWSHLFGEGLVRTPNDFGVRGERPSHPELLDWLADEFVAGGWSHKALVRLIVNSATYRQRAQHRSEVAEVDPQNKLLHRQNRLRVEAEVVRDLHLAASGLLSPRIGGPSAFPPMPEDIAALSYANNFKWSPSSGPDRYRRGLYTFFKRTAPHPDLMTFDCPDANVSVVRRNISNTPLQALTTLNAEAFAEAATALASRVLEESANDQSRLTRAFRLCVARPPSKREVAALRGLLADARHYYARHGDQAKELVGGCATDCHPSEEVAAWTAATRIVLNLDEVITRD